MLGSLLNRRMSPAAGFPAVLAGLLLSGVAQAATPSTPEGRAAAVGKPTALVIQPAAVTLTGPRAVQQLVITGKYADGTVRDLTAFAAWRVEQPGLVEISDGFLTPVKNGTSALVVEV